MSTALEPLLRVISGCLSKLTISEEPYPVPLSVRSTDSILPLNTGWTWHEKFWSVLVETPVIPSTLTTIGF